VDKEVASFLIEAAKVGKGFEGGIHGAQLGDRKGGGAETPSESVCVDGHDLRVSSRVGANAHDAWTENPMQKP